MKKTTKKAFWTTVSSTVLIAMSAPAFAQSSDSGDTDTDVIDEVVATGIRGSLQNAIVEKRNSDNIKEIIQAQDIGKLPDQNLAEVLENITGIQITREAGIGSSVQIRGTDANRVEINGVSTVSSGNTRSGISFQDLPAALISSVEVTKVSTAQTIEGSVGGTINLRTLRPLELKDRLISLRAQGEYSDLSSTFLPRLSATLGDSWSTEAGEFGIVLGASYARQDVSAFLPRFDRDREVLPDSGRGSAEAFPFLRTQFFDQDQDNFEYETLNFNGTLQWAPSEELNFYFDATINDQERVQQSSRVQYSGTGSNAVVDATTNTSFETVNLGSLEGPNGTLELGEVQAVLTGVLGVGVIPGGGIDPNLRTDSNTGSRVTDSRVFALGGEWERDRLTLRAEASLSTSDTVFPSLNTVLDFINPNGPQPVLGQSSDNGVPIVFDARNNTLQFGLAPGLPETPTTQQLLDPANYAIRQVSQARNTNDNKETAFRFDLSYDLTEMVPFFSSVDAGFRWNKSTAVNADVTATSNFTNATSFFNRPRGNLFADILSPGPDNFDAADGRELFLKDFLIVDSQLSFDDPEAVTAALNDAITANNLATGATIPLISSPTQTLSAFFDIEETTSAAYFQANYNTDSLGVPVRGNMGVRWVTTDINSLGNNITNGVVEAATETSSYDFFLPRFNLVVEASPDLLIRGGVARDIRRPDFNDLSLSTAFSGGAGAAVERGNPALQPESVWSYDVSAEYYFSPASLLSVGFFHKSRTNLFGDVTDEPEETTAANGQVDRDITPPCENGGIFNPAADRNVFSSVQGVGICVPLRTRFNVEGSTTQTGVEVAFQYDLSGWEDQLGWASGFGFIGNFTYQETGGSADEFRFANGDANALNRVLGRTDTNQSTPTLADDVVQARIGLLNLSNIAYNATLFYDKYGVNFRARYTWRSDYQIENQVSFNLPDVVGDRGQLNASLNYQVNDNISVGIEGINLLREDQNRFCVNDNALLCFQGLTDRRLTAGVSLRF